MDIDSKKKQVRKFIREEKKKYTLDQKKTKSEIVLSTLEELEEFKSAKVIMAYWSMDDEVYTHDFILKYYKQKDIILPVVNGDYLELKKFSGVENLTSGDLYNISEPKGELYRKVDKIELIVVPGVAFDKQNNRLGRGKAYYDKLLKTSKAAKVGICFDFQLLETIPTDQYDIKMDLVISDN